MVEFNDNLKQMRTQKGLTQAQLAELIFVSRSTVAKWENGLGLPNPNPWLHWNHYSVFLRKTSPPKSARGEHCKNRNKHNHI